MKIKTSELTGGALDWVVLKCESGVDPKHDTVSSWWAKIDGKDRTTAHGWAQAFNPSTNWAHGGPIIDREKLEFDRSQFHNIPGYTAYLDKFPSVDRYCQFGETHLVAAMRCYVESKLGPEVEIPAELS